MMLTLIVDCLPPASILHLRVNRAFRESINNRLTDDEVLMMLGCAAYHGQETSLRGLLDLNRYIVQADWCDPLVNAIFGNQREAFALMMMSGRFIVNTLHLHVAFDCRRYDIVIDMIEYATMLADESEVILFPPSVMEDINLELQYPLLLAHTLFHEETEDYRHSILVAVRSYVMTCWIGGVMT